MRQGIFRKNEEFIMKKRLLASVAAGVLALSVLAGCAAKETAAPTEEAKATESTEKTDNAEEKTDKKVIKVAASATPHAELLEQVKPILAEQGIDLEITVFDDYVQPMNVVEGGEFDANYFAHVPYVEQFNAEQGTHIVNAGGIHYEPFGIYPGTKKALQA